MTNKNPASNLKQVDKKAYKAIAGIKQSSEEKMARIPIKVRQPEVRLRKPAWIRAKSPFHANVKKLKGILREQQLFTVC